MTWEIKHGDWVARLKEMPDESVHCVVTSPPYWGLRDYATAGQLGLEKTPEEYIAKMVEGFREVRRVLRKDGTLWLNMGDSYAATGGHSDTNCNDRRGQYNISRRPEHEYRTFRARGGKDCDPKRGASAVGQPLRACVSFKPKDLVGMPWLLAFALRADGWYLRSDIIWAKPNPMPESVIDRPTKAHEYLFLLTKSSRYFYDAEAIKEEVTGTAHPRGDGINPKATGPKDDGRDEQGLKVSSRFGRGAGFRVKQNASFSGAVNDLVSQRNKRSVWEVATSPFPEAHFATFPPKLVEPCILAGTSERGCCPKCGAPWKRIIERVDSGKRQKMADGWDTGEGAHGTVHRNGREAGEPGRAVMEARTIGWQPACKCSPDKCCVFNGTKHSGIDCPDCPESIGFKPYDPVPCTVLDPFCGAGTTGLVALRYHRNFIGIELKAEYCEMGRRRIEQDAPLFNLRPEQATPANTLKGEE